jgi:hypothetical protein
MLINRIIYILLVIASFVFSSFYGGYIPELIRYSLMFMPVILLAYIFLIYIRMNVGQSISEDTIIKGQKAGYHLGIKNPDILPYINLEMDIYEGAADISVMDGMRHISLMPKENVVYDGSIVCKYAGSYNVGVKNVIIPDFLNLFKIRYRLYRHIKVHVRPIEPDDIDLSDKLCGGMNNKSLNDTNLISNYVGGSSIRDYIPGDSPKRIHWKNSAKLGKLVTRQGDEEPEEGSVIILDTCLTGYKTEDRLIITDRLLHTAVALAKGYIYKEMRYSIIYSNENELRTTHVVTADDYRSFYEGCENISFTEPYPISEVIHGMAEYGYNCNYVIITADGNNKNNITAFNELVGTGSIVTVINVRLSAGEDGRADNGVRLYETLEIGIDDDICEVLSE